MKALAMSLLLLAVVTPVYADDECEAAVDAADSMNVNRKDCDYSDKGLNGFLQKAFKKGDEGAVLETGNKNATVLTDANHATDNTQKTAAKSSALLTGKKQDLGLRQFSLMVEVDQWANLPVARAQLLPKALEKCGKGFSIVGEHYRSLAMGRIELSLDFKCAD